MSAEDAPGRGGERGRRRHRVPPPLTRGGEGAFEGAEILGEVAGEPGGLLWDSLRNVMLWARAPEGARGELFVPGTAERRAGELERIALPERLAAPLRTINGMLARPARTDAAELAGACRGVAEWAWDEGHTGTAVAFMQAAVFVVPADAAAAKEVGRMTRLRGEGPRAESWFLYAIDQARQTGDWESYALAYLGVGNLYGQRGNFPGARRALMRAYRAARRHGHRNVEAMVLHDLFVVAAAVGRVRPAERYAVAAAERYGPGHPRLPVLAQDLAFLWTEHGYFEPALQVFEPLRPLVRGFPEALLLVSATARAAAGAGRAERYEGARVEAEGMVPVPEAQEGVAPAILNLAHAAASRGEWGGAAEAAERARRIAGRTGEAKVRIAAEALLDRISQAESPAAPTEAGVPTGRTSASAERAAEEIRSLLVAGVP